MSEAVNHNPALAHLHPRTLHCFAMRRRWICLRNFSESSRCTTARKAVTGLTGR